MATNIITNIYTRGILLGIAFYELLFAMCNAAIAVDILMSDNNKILCYDVADDDSDKQCYTINRVAVIFLPIFYINIIVAGCLFFDSHHIYCSGYNHEKRRAIYAFVKCIIQLIPHLIWVWNDHDEILKQLYDNYPNIWMMMFMLSIDSLFAIMIFWYNLDKLKNKKKQEKYDESEYDRNYV